ncbi:MAG: S1 RNA-binding domain-containing protein [Clostridiales bacterium]|nr:S1 RNA-binding domain-containing protein [Candidatus Apopatocola equi]
MELIVGAILEGKVSGITGFGAFVSFEGGQSGLVHISEIADTYVNDVHDYLSVGQSVKVKVLNITPEGKINLSVKQALPREERKPRTAAPRSAQGGSSSRLAAHRQTPPEMQEPGFDAGFEEKLKHYMQDSESKMNGNKLYADRKGSSRRRK